MNTIYDQLSLPIIGATEYVSVGQDEKHQKIPAKIDTGADSSSIWASRIRITKDNILEFVLFDKDSKYYTGEVLHSKEFKVAIVRSATGEEQIRYRTRLRLEVAGKKINVLFNLSDRSKNNFPILIGRRSIAGKFLVDTVRKNAPRPPRNPDTRPLNDELKKNPYLFYKKHKKSSLENGK